MQFDLFHSIGRIDNLTPRLSDTQVYSQFFAQTLLAENLGFDTIWVAESHFSSELQKLHLQPVVPNYHGEIGLNSDSVQLAQQVFSKTKKINFGTAIFNILGGNGGPIASANRIRMLSWYNELSQSPRELWIGVGAGRFPYINNPFGILPRNQVEKKLWPLYKRYIFLEALEIFLRLVQGQVFESKDLNIAHKKFTATDLDKAENWEEVRSLAENLGLLGEKDSGIQYQARWNFEKIRLIPEIAQHSKHNHYVLGTMDPLAHEIGFEISNCDIFNLSFTPPDKINQTHRAMSDMARKFGSIWTRKRMPRTVLVFAHPKHSTAESMANEALDNYIEAMRGTVILPPKEELLQRALIGDAVALREQLSPQNERGFSPEDRLMLWFEFSLSDNQKVVDSMRYFAEEVIAYL